MRSPIQLQAADAIACAIGGLIGFGIALGLVESWLRHAAKATR